jgi:uncharacterized protein
MKPRHVPLRTCAGCRQQRPKREMVRVVHGADDAVRVDPTGKAAGRGAYVCPYGACWNLALRGGSLGRVLKVTLREADVSELRAYAASLPERDAASTALPARA